MKQFEVFQVTVQIRLESLAVSGQGQIFGDSSTNVKRRIYKYDKTSLRL